MAATHRPRIGREGKDADHVQHLFLAPPARLNGARLDAHRHQDVERGAPVIFPDQRWGCSIRKVQFDRLAVDLPQNVEQVTRVEADIETFTLKCARHFFRSRAIFGARHPKG